LLIRKTVQLMITIKEKIKRMWIRTKDGDRDRQYLGKYKITTTYLFWFIPVFVKMKLIESNF